MVHVKICGLRTESDARASVEFGASSIGLNFVPKSPRCIDVGTARALARAARSANARTVVVGVVADLTVDEMRALVREAELDCLQLHGNESHATLIALLPHAYKAERIGNVGDVDRARAFPGRHLLVDASVSGVLGGSGQTFDWSLVEELARERPLTLAGGLRPDNVGAAVRAVRPYCVDVASGVERTGEPGAKDLSLVRAFIEATRQV